MAATGSGSGSGGGGGGGGGPGGRKGSLSRDAEAELWCRRVRDLVSSSPANRLCFECGQRGVTYVDISVGSFVCTGCSGALRGLNPPHRVKSISMTTFSEAEVLFLQAHGNEACQRVWLNTFDPRSSLLPESCDPQKLKEFLQDKYEKKRWYLAPEQPKPPPAPPGEAAPNQQQLLGDPGPVAQPRPAPARPCQAGRKASTELLAAIGGDPFAAPPPAPAFAAFPGFPGPAPAPAAFPHVDAFGASPGAAVFGGAAPPFQPATGYSNPFVAPRPPRASTNPFQSNGAAAGAAFTTPPFPGLFSSPFQAEGSPFVGFNVVKASTNPFVPLPAPSSTFSIKPPATNPFL